MAPNLLFLSCINLVMAWYSLPCILPPLPLPLFTDVQFQQKWSARRQYWIDYKLRNGRVSTTTAVTDQLHTVGWIFFRTLFIEFRKQSLNALVNFFLNLPIYIQQTTHKKMWSFVGIMQVAFIWYHLFDAASTYNIIRVFVTSYVWMTGFGNFMFFQHKKDFSLLRILKVKSFRRFIFDLT